jgi:hypothetical protein
MRDFALTTWLLSFVRLLLGRLRQWQAIELPARIVCRIADGRRTYSQPAARWMFPHEWVSMDHVLSDGRYGRALCRPANFDNTNHLLHAARRLAGYLAGWPRPCPVLVARTVRLGPVSPCA